MQLQYIGLVCYTVGHFMFILVHTIVGSICYQVHVDNQVYAFQYFYGSYKCLFESRTYMIYWYVLTFIEILITSLA